MKLRTLLLLSLLFAATVSAEPIQGFPDNALNHDSRPAAVQPMNEYTSGLQTDSSRGWYYVATCTIDTVTSTGAACTVATDMRVGDIGRIDSVTAAVDNVEVTIVSVDATLTTMGFGQTLVTLPAAGESIEIWRAIHTTASATGAPVTASEHKEDDAHVSGEYGALALSRRADTASTSAGTDGDRATFNTDANGALWVRESTSTTNATFAAQTAITAAALNAVYQTIVDLPDSTKIITIDNQTDGDVQVSMTGGASDTYHIKAGDVTTINLASAGLVSTAIIQVKDGTTASTAGSIYVTSIK